MPESKSSFTIHNARILRKDKTTTFLCDIKFSNGKIREILKPGRSKRKVKKAKYDYDARGMLVLPGFIDCHVHLFDIALQLARVNLYGASSIEDFKGRISDFVNENDRALSSNKDEWVIGRGWDQDIFRERRFPTSKDLDDAIKDNPAMMVRVCGHIAVLNSEAIRRIKSLSKLKDDLFPKGENGTPTGIIKETALDECWNEIPKPGDVDLKRLFLRVQKQALGFGLVGAHCILSSSWKDEIRALRELDRSGKLLLRALVFLPIRALDEIESMNQKNRRERLQGRNFSTVGFKLLSDGSLGARTAALIKPYYDDPKNGGILYYSLEQITDYARRVKDLGFILATHAIGDRAVAQVLQAYMLAKITKKDGFRIEHCSVVNSEILKKAENVVLCVQPSFISSDYWINDRLGRNQSLSRRIAYPLKSLLKRTKLIGGSDAPAESLNPLEGVKAAMSNPIRAQSLSFGESVDLYSKNASEFSNFLGKTGRIKSGFECTLAILNVQTDSEISKANVVDLFIKGKRVQK